MLSAAQIQERETGIGGSDIAAVLGLDRFRQPYDVWAEKVGLTPREEAELLSDDPRFWGHHLEQPIAEAYAKRASEARGEPVKVRRVNQTRRHPEYPWLVANIDRDVVGERRGLEIKNVTPWLRSAWGDEGTDEAADYYVPQAHHYLLVLDYDRWDLAAYFGGADLRVYHFLRSREFDELIIERTHAFWHDHVLAGEPPPFDFEFQHAERTLEQLYPGVNARKVVQLGDRGQVLADALELARAHRLNAEKLEQAAKNEIRFLIGDAGAGVLPDGTCFVRRKIQRKGQVVAPSDYIELRHRDELPGPKKENR